MVESLAPDWERIVEDHAARVFRVAMRIIGSVHDAEDVAQDVFAEAFRIFQTNPIQNWTGLFVRLATLRAIDRRRRRRPQQELFENDKITSVEPFQEVQATELADWLRRAITQLPDQQATVFVMVHIEHLSRDEVCRSLGISPETVSTALYKARQRLLGQIAVYNNGESR